MRAVHRVEKVQLEPGDSRSHGQTGLFVQEWGKLFIAVPAQNDQDAEIRVYQAH
jgi:hypothetical protein